MAMRPKARDVDLSRVRRALVVRPDGIGDVVMTTPFLRELRRNLPDAWITLAVRPAVCNLVELCPYMDEVLAYDPGVRGRLRRLHRQWRAFRFAQRHLWRRRFDLAIVPRSDTDNYSAAFVAYFSGARWRVAYSENVAEHKKRENADYDSLFTHTINGNMLKHEVAHNLDVIRFLGGTIEHDRLELWLGADDEAYAEAVIADHGAKRGGLLVAVGPSPGASPLKGWPLGSFIQVARWLCRSLGAHVLLIGAPEERQIGAEIEHAVGPGVINTMGETTLRQSAALIRRCAVFVGNDMGAAHIAAAMGTPVVALFGPSCPHRFAPFGEAHTVVWSDPDCGPCSLHAHQDSCRECVYARPSCMSDISVDHVEEAIGKCLQMRHGSPSVESIVRKPSLAGAGNRASC